VNLEEMAKFIISHIKKVIAAKMNNLILAKIEIKKICSKFNALNHKKLVKRFVNVEMKMIINRIIAKIDLRNQFCFIFLMVG